MCIVLHRRAASIDVIDGTQFGVSQVYNKGLGMHALLSVSAISLYPGIRQPECIVTFQLRFVLWNSATPNRKDV